MCICSFASCEQISTITTVEYSINKQIVNMYLVYLSDGDPSKEVLSMWVEMIGTSQTKLCNRSS